VTLVSGENTIRVMAPVVGDVTVIDPDAKEGSEMRLQWTEARAGAGGVFVWKGVPEGEYEIRQSYGRYKSMKITVNGTTTLNFSPIQFNAMKVKITDTNGVLAKAGFRDGDYL